MSLLCCRRTTGRYSKYVSWFCLVYTLPLYSEIPGRRVCQSPNLSYHHAEKGTTMNVGGVSTERCVLFSYPLLFFAPFVSRNHSFTCFRSSLQVWMCGGGMFDVPCSRVGHIYRKYVPYKVPSGTSLARVSNWVLLLFIFIHRQSLNSLWTSFQ